VIVYLHGFNSSPQSHKAQVFARHMAERALAAEFACPTLPPSAREAIRVAERLAGKSVCYVGSSLGGFYATYLVEKHGGRAVLINPAIDPHIGLRTYLGPQKNLCTGEPYELTEAHTVMKGRLVRKGFERIWSLIIQLGLTDNTNRIELLKINLFAISCARSCPTRQRNPSRPNCKNIWVPPGSK